MAMFKTANCKGKYFDDNAKEDVINYVLNPDKMPHRCCGGVKVDKFDIAGSMYAVSEYYNKTNGVQLRHFIVSFSKNELNDPYKAKAIAQEIMYHLGKEYQAIYGVHENGDIHIHIVMNSVSYVDGHRYYGKKEEYYSFYYLLCDILRKYGINKLMRISNRG